MKMLCFPRRNVGNTFNWSTVPISKAELTVYRWFYGKIYGPPVHVNCRCSVKEVLK